MAKTIYDPKTDPRFQHPVIDQDEWRERYLPDGVTIPFRYLHGYFEGTDVKFAFCFPTRDQYEGRFQQYLSPFPGPDEEVASLGHTGLEDRIGFALRCGAYYVETNMGSHSQFGGHRDDFLTWQSSAAAAEYSREKAMEIYETDQRPYGYVYGGSGGGYKSMACIENTRAWDGAAPFVIGSPVSLPNTITMHVQGQRVLRNAFGKILDALDAGGSGDPYKELNKDEADMLRELTKMGFPPLAWYLEAKGVIDPGSLPVLLPGVKQLDPGYFTDFWTKPGYAGSDPESSSSKDHIVFRTKIKSVHLPEKAAERHVEDGLNGVDDAWKKQLAEGNGAYLELEDLPKGDNLYLEGLSMVFESGEAKGANLLMGKMMRYSDRSGGIVTIGSAYGTSDVGETLVRVQPGDDILLDNSDYVAMQSYYRHQVPDDLSFHAWDQFRDESGNPVTAQRPPFPVPFTGVGVPQDGNIQGKVLNIQALMDESTCPWCADWWRHKIIETKGTDADHRTYFMERCMHGDVNALGNYMVVNYVGALRQALIDLSAWVERGVPYLWGSISAQEMVRRFWRCYASGGYCTHGETFLSEGEILWWARGGKLKGESPRHIAFLREIMESLPGPLTPVFSGLTAIAQMDEDALETALSTLPEEMRHAMTLFGKSIHRMDIQNRSLHLAGEHTWEAHCGEDAYLWFNDLQCYGEQTLRLPKDNKYRVEVIDIWEMTRETICEDASGETKIRLPGKENLAVLAMKVEG